MNFQINVEKREIHKKKSFAKGLRKAGIIPAIVYTEGKVGSPIQIDENEFNRTYKKSIGEVAFFDFVIDGKKFTTVIKDKQIHPVSRRVVHIDFLELHKGKEITIDIPLKFIGEAAGVKKGGMLNVLMREVSVTCFPKDIAEDFEIDVSLLEIGDSLAIDDIDSKDLKINLAPDIAVVNVLAPRKEEEPEVEEDEAIESEDGEEKQETPESES